MVKKLTIECEEETGYSVIGISSTLKDYRLLFFLNKLENFDFKRVKAFVFNIKNQEFNYSMYTFVDEFNMKNYYLIANKSRSVKLVPEYKYFDYILILDGEFEESYITKLVKAIKSVKGVMLASVADIESINKVPNLSLLFEMHLDQIFKSN